MASNQGIQSARSPALGNARDVDPDLHAEPTEETALLSTNEARDNDTAKIVAVNAAMLLAGMNGK
jgi:hypothetical protein